MTTTAVENLSKYTQIQKKKLKIKTVKIKNKENFVSNKSYFPSFTVF